jgi:hypothetical protein
MSSILFSMNTKLHELTNHAQNTVPWHMYFKTPIFSHINPKTKAKQRYYHGIVVQMCAQLSRNINIMSQEVLQEVYHGKIVQREIKCTSLSL